jgi:hypothetical protein
LFLIQKQEGDNGSHVEKEYQTCGVGQDTIEIRDGSGIQNQDIEKQWRKS